MISGKYNWEPEVPIPAMGLCAFVSASRIQDKKHHLSDVLGGALLGIGIGLGINKYYDESNSFENLEVSPIVTPDSAFGLGFNYTF